MANKKNEKPASIGGQAIIEGVMMRGIKTYTLAVRAPDNTISVVKHEIKSATDRNKLFKLPVIRGVFAFVDSLVIGTKTITESAELAGMAELEDTTEPSKFEKYITDKLGDKLNDVIIGISVVFAIALSILLFMLLPVYLSNFFKSYLPATWMLGILEGIVRLLIFIVYILIISKMKEIKRVFEYHGAEHKTINCFENKEELSVENVRGYTRFHKRCGTSFLILVMLISMIVFAFIKTDDLAMRFISRILLVPVIAGLSYEVIKWAGRSKSVFVKIVSFPGIALQNITTSEPDDSQIETAIAALNGVLEAEPHWKKVEINE